MRNPQVGVARPDCACLPPGGRATAVGVRAALTSRTQTLYILHTVVMIRTLLLLLTPPGTLTPAVLFPKVFTAGRVSGTLPSDCTHLRLCYFLLCQHYVAGACGSPCTLLGPIHVCLSPLARGTHR